MSSQDMSAEENRWFVFYRDSLWKVCLQDGIDFQQNFPSDMNTLHDFIENNYPIALFTLLQNADSITVTFVESALPLLLLSIQHIRYLLLQHDDSHPLHQWAYYKFEDIETYCIRIFYELLIQPHHHVGIQESVIHCISEILPISKHCRHQLVKKIKFQTDNLPHEHLSCFITIFHITSLQRNNFKLLTYFSDILIQLSCHEHQTLTAALADTFVRRGLRLLTCFDFLRKHLFRLHEFLNKTSSPLKHQPKAIIQNYLSIKIAAYSIACSFCSFLVRSAEIFKRVKADKDLRVVVLDTLEFSQGPQRPDLLRIIPEARKQLLLQRDTDKGIETQDFLPADPKRKNNLPAHSGPAPETPQSISRARPSTAGTPHRNRSVTPKIEPFVPHSPSPGKFCCPSSIRLILRH